MPSDKSTNFQSNALIGYDDDTEHFGFGRDPVTNQSTRARVINTPGDPAVAAPAGSIALADTGTIWLNTDGTAIGWVALSTTASDVFLAPGEYWIDNTITDAPTLREFSTVAAALAYINTLGPPPFGSQTVFRMQSNQTHLWDGTNWLDDRALNFYSAAEATDTVINLLGMDLSALFGGNPLRFRNLNVGGPGINTGARFVLLDQCGVFASGGWTCTNMTITGGLPTGGFNTVGGTFTINGGVLTIAYAVVSAGFKSDNGGTYNAIECVHKVGSVWFAGLDGLTINITGGSVDTTVGNGLSVFGNGLALPFNTTLKGVSLIVAASGACSLFEGSAASASVLDDVSILANVAGAGTLALFHHAGTIQLNDVRLGRRGAGAVVYTALAPVTTLSNFVNGGTSIAAQPSGTYYNNGVGFVAVEP